MRRLSFLGLWGLIAFLACPLQASRATTATTNSVAVKIERLEDGYHSLEWDNEVAVVENSPSEVPLHAREFLTKPLGLMLSVTKPIPVATNKRDAVLEQVMPWLKLVLSDEFIPVEADNPHMLVMFAASGQGRGHDIYKLVYSKGTAQITILDTCGALIAIFRDPQIKRGDNESIAGTWQSLVRRFMRKPERFDCPASIRCPQDSKVIYVYPHYPEYSRLEGTGVECWWGSADYKITDGMFRVSVIKRIDGEHFVGTDCSITNRYERLRAN